MVCRIFFMTQIALVRRGGMWERSHDIRSNSAGRQGSATWQGEKPRCPGRPRLGRPMCG